MKIRGSGGKAEKIEAQMAPMIDVVFQLLIFFMLTLKIIEPEGSFDVNVPIGQPPQAVAQNIQVPIKVRLKADDSGDLQSLTLGTREFLQEGNEDAAFEQLNIAIGGLVEVNPLREEMEVELEADYNLNYEYVIRAIGACRGKARRNRQGKVDVIPYIERIKFAPRREPPAKA